MAAPTTIHSLVNRTSLTRCLQYGRAMQQRSLSQTALTDQLSPLWRSALARPISRSTLNFARHNSTSRPDVSELKPAVQQSENPKPPNLRKEHPDPRDAPRPKQDERGEVPAYELTFTCKPCKTRSAHRISKHGYHNGTVMITCPNCKNRHVISDHLKIFNDTSKSFAEILEEKAEQIKTGALDPDGDFEIWDDGSKTARKKDTEGVPVAGQAPST